MLSGPSAQSPLSSVLTMPTVSVPAQQHANAASGHNAGIEWELRVRPTEDLEAYANLGLLSAEFSI